VTTLPSNLALVGEDLARATLRDARRSLKRRRLVVCAVAFALLALTASAAVATGWLSEKSPTARALPALSAVGTESAPRLLLTDLGSGARALTSYTTAKDAVCLTLTGFEVQCVPAFLAKQQVSWYTHSLSDGTTLIYGLARADVDAIDAVSADGHVTPAQLGNGAFYLEVGGSVPTRVVLHLSDGTDISKPASPCPPATPDCVS
jgi:hypothetical protein